MLPSYSEMCSECQKAEYEMNQDDRGGMTIDEQVEFVVMNITNGNLTDAINFMMRDGDVTSDSVKLALRVQNYMTLHHVRSLTAVTDQLIRLIESWETT